MITNIPDFLICLSYRIFKKLKISYKPFENFKMSGKRILFYKYNILKYPVSKKGNKNDFQNNNKWRK